MKWYFFQDFEFDNEPIHGSPDYIDDHLDPPTLKNDLDLLNSKLINDHNHVDNDDLKTEKFDEKMDLSTREDVKVRVFECLGKELLNF